MMLYYVFKNFFNKKDYEIEKENISHISWELEVYRNTHNLCVWCGKPMTTTVFSDVPVCDEHKDK